MLCYDVETTRPIILTHIPLSETERHNGVLGNEAQSFFEQFRIRSESIEHQSGVRAATFSQDVSSYLISRTLVIERDYDVGKLLTRTGATSTGIPTTAGRFRAAATRRSKE